MEENPLLPLPKGMQIEQIRDVENEVSITVIATHPLSSCPLCRQPSCSVHSRYRRTVRDAPCAGRRVQLILCVRKFFCRNPLCERKIFTERLPDLVHPWAKMTIRSGEQLTSIGLATSGKTGTRLAARLGIKTTRQTVLRRIMALPDDPLESILYLGIDDFAFRRGCRFGTILVNLESRRVVDLLPNREAETAAAWMRRQVELMAVSRDRGGEYASAVAQGAPQAIQCADRFHLMKNLGEALEGLLAHHLAAANRQQIAATVQEQAPIGQPKRAARTSPKVERLQHNRREERLATYSQVMALQKLGMSQQAIASQVGISDRTVQRWLAAGTFPERKPREQASQLDPYLPYLIQRWETGYHTIADLFRELVEQGFKGSYSSVYGNLVSLLPSGRKNGASSSPKVPTLPTSRQAACLFLRRTERLSVEEQETLVKLRQINAEVEQASDLVQQFTRMLRARTGDKLDAWLDQVDQSGLPELQSFAAGIKKDKEAVRAGLTWWINNGVVEGSVTKLKLIKRQGYGRAGFPLLRKRVLHAL